MLVLSCLFVTVNGMHESVRTRHHGRVLLRRPISSTQFRLIRLLLHRLIQIQITMTAATVVSTAPATLRLV